MHGKALLLTLSLAFSTVANSWEPMVVENGHIRVESSVAGVKGYSIIDTGAEVNAINTNFVRSNNLKFDRSNTKVRISGVYDEDTRRVYNTIPVNLWGTDIPFRGLVDLNLGEPDLQLLLGAGFLANFIFQFDYPNKRMRVFPRDAMNLKKLKNLQSKRDPGGGSPLVKVKMDGRAVWLTLDTGNSSGIVIDRTIAMQEKWLSRYEEQSSSGRGVISSGQSLTFSLDTLEIGPFELGNTLVSVPKKGRTWKIFERTSTTGSNVKRQRGKSRGLLGYDVLKHFVLTIDYKTGHLHIAPPEKV